MSAAGLTAYDAVSGEHVLQTQALPDGVLAAVTPLVLRQAPRFPAVLFTLSLWMTWSRTFPMASSSNVTQVRVPSFSPAL